MTQSPAHPPLDEAELYALLHTGNPGDVEHYERICQGAESVLELGSGAGRITLHLAKLGHRVTGLELDPKKLERAKQAAERELTEEQRARLTFVLGDMTSFDLGRTFDRIIVPYNGLYCLGGIRGALHCFEAAAKHLAQEGELWLDAYAVDGFHAEAPEGDDAEEDPEPVAEIEVSGRKLWAFEKSAWDREEQRLDVSYALKTADGAVIAEQHVLHHYLLGTEVVLLLDEAGFEVTSLNGGFSGEPFDDDAQSLVVGARPLAEGARETD